ncbi:hypothetical protein [Kribbella sp. NPDC048915]|uniref:hypothetical protein n=1 Tax=Kribbella sp. NPDC048915 TaxID=3155148 RepID=UPI0033DF8A5B
MTDTETRLHDYFQTQADTVPDTAEGPGLAVPGGTEPTRSRRWPVLLAAAAVAGALALTATVLSGVTDREPSVAGIPSASSVPVPAGKPLIPYAVTVQNNPDNPLDTWWATIHDGDRTVKNPGVQGDVLARVDGGWLVTTGYPDPAKSQAAVVSPSGQVRPLGPLGAGYPVVSPDGRQIAVPLSKSGAPSGEVVVVDVKSGDEVARVTVTTPNLELIGWNKDGVWMNPHSPDARPVTVWQPGPSNEVRTVGNLEGEIVVARGTGTVVQLTNKGGRKYCANAATLGAKGLEIKREYCFDARTTEGNVVAPYVALSPDGMTMVLSTQVAVDVATGQVSSLTLPAKARLAGGGVFENPANVVVIDDAQAEQKMFRCAVASGECKQVVTSAPDEIIKAVQP